MQRITWLSLVLTCWLTTIAPATYATGKQPNIVWLIAEDMSAHFSCYGETAIDTPHLDRLAAEGTRFTDAVVTAPVCSASRSALITGMYQTSIGAHHHRSGRGKLKIHLPDGVELVPELFNQAGYVSLNLSFKDFVRPAEQVRKKPKVRIAKTDYNFEWDNAVYGQRHWDALPADQPFFVQIQLDGGKYRGHAGLNKRWSGQVKSTLGSCTPTSLVKLPPYYPADPIIVADWAAYLDTVRYTDWEVGQIIQRLRDAGQLDQTVIFFITDHGVSHVRDKQFCYDGGIHIPLVVNGPNIPAGTVRNDVVEQIDLAATSLALAGIPIPDWMQARDILADDYQPREYVFSARDRCDETIDHIRSVRSERYKYIRNYRANRPYLLPNAYKDDKPIQRRMRELYAAGELEGPQLLVMASTRPVEELYDLEADPHEIHNLADDPTHAEVLADMRQALDNWIVQTGDQGEQPESLEMYQSDMAAYIGPANNYETQQAQKNMQLMLQWAAEDAAAKATEHDDSLPTE